MLNEIDFRKNFGNNLNKLRKQRGLTQQELAEQLNYSDKAVSKWERGESIPDTYTLYSIAAYFSVSIDDLLADKETTNVSQFRDIPKNTPTKLFVPLITVFSIFFVASIFFLVMKNVDNWVSFADYSFIYALPVASIALTVFSSIWGKTVYRCISVSLVIWTSALSIYLSLNLENLKYIFISCAFLQVATIFIYLLAYYLSNKKSK